MIRDLEFLLMYWRQKILFLYIIILYAFSSFYANSQLNGNLELLSIENGLSQSYVNVIYQDSKGYIWVGTQNGLNRYDGYSFRVFKYQPNDPYSISDNQIRCITEDSYQNIWIGTSIQLNYLLLELEIEKCKIKIQNSIYHQNHFTLLSH